MFQIQMIADDLMENERIDARNALEEFVYELRSQLGSGESLANYVKEEESSTLSVVLENMETWLYEDGENCERLDYINRLAELKVISKLNIYLFVRLCLLNYVLVAKSYYFFLKFQF